MQLKKDKEVYIFGTMKATEWIGYMECLNKNKGKISSFCCKSVLSYFHTCQKLQMNEIIDDVTWYFFSLHLII